VFTVCPKCGLTLAITVRDLRAAHGHVRCGRCQNVFNALDSLSEEHPHAPASAGRPGTPLAQARVGQPAAAPPVHPLSIVPSSETPAAAEIAVEFEPQEPIGPLSATQLPERSPPPAEMLRPDLDRPLPEALRPDLDRPLPEALRPDADGLLPEALRPEPATTQAQPTASFELEDARPRASILWSVGTVLLIVLLALQSVNHYRNVLATIPSIGGPLRTAYHALGIELAPAWDVHAYEARQLGATVSGTNPSEITVRASIANLAQRPQPLPLLRVTLQNRFGRSIAARDVPPRDYLPSVPSPPLLAPGARVDASVVFISPGPSAVGFVIDACLPERHTVVCAHGR
jgi:predicted Zn finger-like uncharacterized protein